MLMFATSDKGGTGRSVTSSNIAYRCALGGKNAGYLDFDFGSPTSGAIFELPEASTGVVTGGLHSCLLDGVSVPARFDVWTDSRREVLRGRPAGAGRLVLLPGDAGRGEFGSRPEIIERCIELLLQANDEFDLVIIDLSAGRSYATEIVLAATADERMRAVPARWVVFHRWTRQHIVAASSLVHGAQGILDTGEQYGHDRTALRDSIRFVRTAMLDLSAPDQSGLRPEQFTWSESCNRRLQELAGRRGIGRATVLAEIPLDPVLQWQEQLLSNDDVWMHRTANEATITAFEDLAKKIVDESPDSWEGL